MDDDDAYRCVRVSQAGFLKTNEIDDLKQNANCQFVEILFTDQCHLSTLEKNLSQRFTK